MITVALLSACLWNVILADNLISLLPIPNVTRSTVRDIAAYRSALTLDWLAAEDFRQREVVAAFETERSAPRLLTSECMSYLKPSTGKVASLLLELMKSLEGDEGTLLVDFIQALINAKLLIETSTLDSEPSLDSLVKTPGMMLGEPHTTFPRIIAMVWMVATDPDITKKHGWCFIKKVTRYLQTTKPTEIARHMRHLQPVVTRTRYIMEEFIQSLTPVNIYHTRRTTTLYTRTDQPNDIAYTNDIDFTTRTMSNTPERPLQYRTQGTSSPQSFGQVQSEYDDQITWMLKNKQPQPDHSHCQSLQPLARDIVRRFYAIVSHFDKDHSNTVFLHKYRGAIYGMSEGEDLLDREAAFYAATMTPIIFLQQYKDTWCLMERFHRALRLYQMSHPTEKRSALKMLQSIRSVNNKVAGFIGDISGLMPPVLHSTSTEQEDEEFHDVHKKDIKWIQELIKNLG